MGVAIGIDSHKRSLGAGATDELGREVAAKEFPNDPKGHGALLGWTRAQGVDRVIGIEGSGSYGAGVARFLLQAGEDVREVPAFVAHRERKKSPSKGKSDLADAIAIARVTARGDGLFSPHRSEVLQDLKLLSDHRDQLVRARTQLSNRIHRDLVVAHPGYQERVPDLRSTKNVAQAAKLVRGDRSVRADLTRRRIAQLRSIDKELAENKAEISVMLERTGTTLAEISGIGALLAAKILAEVGDVTKIRSESAFAMFTGTAPLQASSGATTRHRLNRGGNRQLNHALHYMALVQYRSHPDARAYIERKRAEGKSFKEAMRCLKRHLAKVIYRRLRTDASNVEIAP
jgi:transposase